MIGPSGGFLRTTVGRRLFWRFLMAAFLPTAATAGLAWYAVQGHMRSGIEARVSQDAKLSSVHVLVAVDEPGSVAQLANAVVAGRRAMEDAA